MPLYETAEDSPWGAGRPVTTQSMIKAFLQCPMEVYYKYHLRLQPKSVSIPLTRGKWIHALLEVYYRELKNGGSKAHALEEMWQEHRLWSGRFFKLFDEEKERLGDLPRTIGDIMRGYFWHYGDPQYQDYNEWKVVDVELTLEGELPNGHIYRGRFDLLVENEYGLWLVDHKSHKRLPDWSHRMMDIQAPLYTWAAHQCGIPVLGFIWNYLATTPHGKPRVLKDGTRFSKTGWETTDYPTALQAVKEAGWVKDRQIHVPDNELHTEEIKAHLRSLKSQRWAPGEVPTSPFYRRDEIMHDPAQIDRVLASVTRTSERMHEYDFSDQRCVERNTAECKGWKCSYQSLSMADLVVGDSDRLRRSDYMVGDPLAYYESDTEGDK